MNNYEPGSLLAFKWDNDSYGVCKVLQITETRKEPIINIVTYSNWFEGLPENVDTAQLKTLVVHMPMLLPALEISGCTLVGADEVKPQELDGYENWLGAWQDRRAGFFTRSIPDSIDEIMEQMAVVDSPGDSAHKERLMQQWSKMRR